MTPQVSPMKAFPNTPVVKGKASWGPPACAVADPTWVTCPLWDPGHWILVQGLDPSAYFGISICGISYESK